MKFFYSHLIEIEETVTKLDELELSDLQRKDLASLIDSHIHHEILDLILEKLTREDKSIFLKMLHEDPKNEKIIEHLKTKVENIDIDIKEAAKKLKQDLHKDIEDAKREGKNK